MNWAENFESLFTVASLVSLLTLIVLEIVLGIDNIIFISIIANRLKNREEQKKARSIGLTLALFMRIGLLFSIAWLVNGAKAELFKLFGTMPVSMREIILFAGGVFLLVKTTTEIHHKIEGEEEEESDGKKKQAGLGSIIMQIVLIDIVFSFDSILTAVGVVDNVLVMILAVIVSMIVMLIFAGRVADFINRHPTVKMLALAFLLMIGMLLVLESFHVEVPKAYVYSSMAFAFLVEMLNMRMRSKKQKKAAVKKKDTSDFEPLK
jgi:predicted tellurium resistance membrane protein TerC